MQANCAKSSGLFPTTKIDILAGERLIRECVIIRPERDRLATYEDYFLCGVPKFPEHLLDVNVPNER